MSEKLTLGSLFSGSGGFELAGVLAGIKPIWASEIEPFPIRVTTKNLHFVKHLGDVSAIKGNEIEAVDIITFGSPCQDMSVAGKRAGLNGPCSSLFHEAIRIIKEMRGKTNEAKPRYIVWENVEGAFSSNKGEDFREVLSEITSIKGCQIDVPRVEKWYKAGLIMADNFSLAWRVLDAQYFGVPQRRKRIYLVADLDGQSAREILFEEKSVPRNFESSKKTWERTTECVETGTFNAIRNISLADQGGMRMDVNQGKTGTITASMRNHPPLVFENHSQANRFRGPLEVSNTLTSRLGTGGNNQPFVVEDKICFDVRLTSNKTKNKRANIYETELARTVDTGRNSCESNQGGVAIVYTTSKSSHHTRSSQNLANALMASDYKDPPLINTLNKNKRYAVRRITPKECGRLQGFPDEWCENLAIENPSEEDISFWTSVFETHRKVVTKKTKAKSEKQIRKWLLNPHSDSAEYKMWGNGIALPCACYVLLGIKQADK